MPCVLGNKYGYSTGGGGHDQSFAYTVAAGSNFLLASFIVAADTCSETSSINTVTYNGVGMTNLQAQGWYSNVGGCRKYISLWVLANPATGSNTFAYTTSDNNAHSGVVISDWAGVASYRTSMKNYGVASYTQTAVITSEINDTVVGACCSYGSLPVTDGGTLVEDVDANSLALTSEDGTATSTTLDWDTTVSDTWGVVGVALVPIVPVVTSLDIVTGPMSGGTTVVITGTGFTGTTGVTFGGHAASGVTVDSSTQVHCETPADTTAGLVDVIVTTPYGSGTKSNAFTYFPLGYPIIIIF
jgi:hypothetical protein